jgi:hypothetical protein
VIGGVIERPPLVSRDEEENYLDNDLVVRIWDQEVYFFCGLRFEPCGCSYNGY